MPYVIVTGPNFTRPGAEKLVPELIAPFPSIPIMVQPADEIDTADAIEKIIKSITAQQAIENDTAIAVINKRILIAYETDFSQQITANRTIVFGQAFEASSAQTILATKTTPVAQVIETNSAQAIASQKTKEINQTTETDNAQVIIIAEQTVSVGQAFETDIAQAMSNNPQRRLISQATETNTAQTITVGTAFTNIVLENDITTLIVAEDGTTEIITEV